MVPVYLSEFPKDPLGALHNYATSALCDVGDEAAAPVWATQPKSTPKEDGDKPYLTPSSSPQVLSLTPDAEQRCRLALSVDEPLSAVLGPKYQKGG